MEEDAYDIPSIFRACRTYQQNNKTKTKRTLSDQTFLDQVRDFLENNDHSELISAIPDVSTYNRNKTNAPSRVRNADFLKALVLFLEHAGYWPEDREILAAAEQMCVFWGALSQSRSSSNLSDIVGQYRGFQRSSWFPDHIQISTFTFNEPPDPSKPFLKVSEHQATGSLVAKSAGAFETVENFNGIAFARQNMLFLALREERTKAPKFCLIYRLIPNSEEEPASYVEGFTLKASQGPNTKLHITRLIMERLKDEDLEQHDSRVMPPDRFKEEFPDRYVRLFEIPMTQF
jgi:hypothetical protein